MLIQPNLAEHLTILEAQNLPIDEFDVFFFWKHRSLELEALKVYNVWSGTCALSDGGPYRMYIIIIIIVECSSLGITCNSGIP